MTSNIAAVFGALGDETRLAIIAKLHDGTEQSITNLTQGLSLTRQGVSRHLHVLEDAKLVRRNRIGRETRYQINVKALNRARQYLERASVQWDDATARLANHLED